MEKNIYYTINVFLSKFHLGGIIIGGNSFMRAKMLQEIDGFDTSITFYGDDTETARRLSKQGRIVFNPNLIIRTSFRRFKKEGIIKTQLKCIIKQN